MLLHILPLYLSVLYIFSFKITQEHSISECLFFLLTSFFIALFGYFVNDLFDIKEDKSASKINMFSEIGIKAKAFLLIGIISLICFFGILSKLTPIAIILILIELILFVIYSASFIRFKNNPILGPLCDAHYAHILPVFITLYYLNIHLELFPLLLLYSWLLLKGFRNILLHQIDDRKADSFSKILTFPIYFGVRKTMYFLNFIVLPSELIILISLLLFYLPDSNLILVTFIIYQIFFLLLQTSFKFQERPLKYYYFTFLYYLNYYYEFWLPLSCILIGGFNLKNSLILLFLHLFVYRKKTHMLVNDLTTIVSYRLPENYKIIRRGIEVLYIKKFKYRIRDLLKKL